MNWKLFFSTLWLVMSAGQGFAHDFRLGDIVVDHPYARETPSAARIGGGFMVLRNEGDQGEELIAASADWAERIEIHEHVMNGDRMEMRALPSGLKIPAQSTIALEPGGYHLMFFGLKTGLIKGQTRKLTLQFKQAGTLEVEFQIEPLKSMPSNHSH